MQNDNENGVSARRKVRPAELLVLFWEFFKIAALVVGGGYAILLVAEDVFAKKLKWLRDNELAEMLVLIQTIPGLLAGNIAIYIGHRRAGVIGAITALFGVALPSYLIISLVATGFAFIPVDSPVLLCMFRSVRAALAGLMLVAFVRLWRQAVRDYAQLALFILCALSIALFHIAPGWLILAGLMFGPLYCLLICRRMPAASELQGGGK